MSARKPSSIATKIVATFAVAALSLSAFAGRYWLGTVADSEGRYLLDEAQNWASSSETGSGGKGMPGAGTSTTYFYTYKNGSTFFNTLATLENNVCVATKSDDAFVWDATDLNCGFLATGKELQIDANADRAPTSLTIRNGSYSFQKITVGQTTNSRTTLTMEGGFIESGNNDPASQSDFIICNGSGETASADVVVNGGRIFVNGNSLYVGYNGRGSLTINNGGTVEVRDSDKYGLAFGHGNTHKRDSGTLILNNGGKLIIPRVRSDMVQEGSKIVFNGGTLTPTRGTTSFIKSEIGNLVCELGDGGLVVDTAGFDITIAHELVLGSGVTSAPLIKKGAGVLTITGSTPFTSNDITVYEGTAVVGGTTYTQNAGPVGIDVSEGGSYGPYALHGNKLESWLEAPLNFTHFSSSTANGTESYEMPESLTFSGGSEVKNWTNLRTGETYGDTLGGIEYSFTTKALAPRTIKIEAPDGTTVANVRDVGSWPLESLNGKKMNQDVLFRGASLDAFTNATAYAKSESFLSQIGLKTEIELRPEGLDLPDFYSGVTASFAADDCEYVNCGMAYNGGPQLDSDNGGNFTNMIRKVFSTWGTAGKLPSYFHCRIGRDRTGMVGLLVLGLMGVEEEVLYRDYLLSNFAKLDSGLVDTPRIETCLRHLLRGNCNSGKYVYSDNEYGSSVAARCRAYLEMCGVTVEEIGRITQSLSGETPAEVLARVDAYETKNRFRTVSYVPYEGSSTTNAMHRLAAGQHILPTATPSREGWLFGGWDTDHEAPTGEGTAVVYAKWTVDKRYWADSNGASEKFNRAESWDPAPGSMESTAGDTFVLNKGEDKIAVVEGGDDVTVGKLCVGQGENNRGGRLDVTGGSLNVAEDFIVGDDTGASAASNIVRVTGGTVGAKKLRVGKSGKGEFTLDGGSLELGSGDLILCDNANGDAKVNLLSGTVAFHQLDITQNGGKAEMNIGNGCGVDMDWALYMGANATLNVGGVLDTKVSVNIGNRAGGPSVVNLIGDENDRGLLITTEFVSVNDNGVFNWNGGRLMREPSEFIHVNDIVPAVGAQGATSKLKVFVGANGAYYESQTSTSDDAISQPLSGVGAFNKLGEGTLTIKGAFSCRGGINVEGGALAFQSGAIALADMKEISVYEDGKLDLGGAQVTVRTYRIAGDGQLPGTYHEQGGTIRVLSAEALVPVAAEWRNLAGDGDFANPDNWIVRNESGDVLFDMLPTTDTDVVVIYDGFARDCSSIQCKSLKVVVESDARFAAPNEISAAVPEFARNALAWYDLADASTVTVNGDSRLTKISNKGVAGSVMNATCGVGPSKYGEKLQRWRNLLAMKEEFGFSSPNGSVNTAMGGSEAMTLVVLSRNVPKVKSETESVTRMYTMGIVNDGGSPSRIFSFSIEDDKGSGSSSVKYGANVEMGGVTKSPLNEWNIWTLRYDPATHEVSATRCGMDGEVTAFGPESVGEMSLPADCALFIGVMPRNGYQSSCGDIAEAFMFGSALTDNQLEAMRTYLGNKWLGSIERQIVPGCLEIAQGATLDFGGGDWTLDKIKGAGTIGTANVTVTGSLDAGLTVGGKLTFAEGATIDISCFDKTAIGSEVVFLTADSIVNWPHKVRSRTRMCAPRCVENGDGTVSLVGVLSATRFAIHLR